MHENHWLLVNGIASLALVPSIFVFWLCKRDALPFAWLLWFYMATFLIVGVASLVRALVPNLEPYLIPFIACTRVVIAALTPFAVYRITRWPGPAAMTRTCRELASEVGRLSERYEPERSTIKHPAIFKA